MNVRRDRRKRCRSGRRRQGSRRFRTSVKVPGGRLLLLTKPSLLSDAKKSRSDTAIGLAARHFEVVLQPAQAALGQEEPSPAAPAERPLSVQLNDLRRGRALTGRMRRDRPFAWLRWIGKVRPKQS